MQKFIVRAVMSVALVMALAACSRPASPPSLSKLVGDTAALSSFDSLVDALALDLNAATASGQFTVFAPSNALVDAYAQLYGYDDAADLLSEIDGFGSDTRQALRNFVLAHVVVYAPGVMTKAFLTGDIEPNAWELENRRQPPGGLIYTKLSRQPLFNLLEVAPSLTPITPGELVITVEGAAPGVSYEATVFGITFVAADVRFANGLVHIISGTAEIIEPKK